MSNIVASMIVFFINNKKRKKERLKQIMLQALNLYEIEKYRSNNNVKLQQYTYKSFQTDKRINSCQKVFQTVSTGILS